MHGVSKSIMNGLFGQGSYKEVVCSIALFQFKHPKLATGTRYLVLTMLVVTLATALASSLLTLNVWPQAAMFLEQHYINNIVLLITTIVSTGFAIPGLFYYQLDHQARPIAKNMLEALPEGVDKSTLTFFSPQQLEQSTPQIDSKTAHLSEIQAAIAPRKETY